MATVYLAEDVKHNRQVAVKVLRSDLSAQIGLNRFLREIEVTAKLQHPHILPLFDSGEADGVLFYVMPFVNGETLRERIDRERELPIGEVVRLLRDVVDALSHAHAHGVVHRDIKPGNVLLAGRHAMVADFGIAKAVTEATGSDVRTSVGIALGTPTYMAPEQALAQSEVDHRADIYAVGAMGYEMLAGRPPFSGTSTMAVLFGHVSAAPEPVRAHRAAIPAQLGELVMKCLEKDPAERWQTADEVLQQLDGLITPSEGVAPSPANAPLASTAPPRVFTRTRSILAGTFALLAVVTLLAVNRFSGQDATALQPVKETRTEPLRPASFKAAEIDQPTGTKPTPLLAGKETERKPPESAARKVGEIDQPLGKSAATVVASKEPASSDPNPAANDAEDVASLSSLLSEYAQAIEARDTSNMIAVYPSMSDSQKARWMEFFAAMKTFRAALTMHGLVVSGDKASASVAGAYFYVEPDGRPNRRVIKYDVRFGKQLGAWIILSMQ